MKRACIGLVVTLTAVVGLGVGVTGSAGAATPMCDDSGTHGGQPVPSGSNIQGNLIVPVNAFCTLDNVRVSDKLIVKTGGDLTTQNDSDIGSLVADGADSLHINYTTFHGLVHALNMNSSSSSRVCNSTVGGNLVIESTSGIYWLVGDCAVGVAHTFVDGNLVYNSNSFGGDISNTTIGGSLKCAGNSNLTGHEDESGATGGPHNDGNFGNCASFDFRSNT